MTRKKQSWWERRTTIENIGLSILAIGILLGLSWVLNGGSFFYIQQPTPQLNWTCDNWTDVIQSMETHRVGLHMFYTGLEQPSIYPDVYYLAKDALYHCDKVDSIKFLSEQTSDTMLCKDITNSTSECTFRKTFEYGYECIIFSNETKQVCTKSAIYREVRA